MMTWAMDYLVTGPKEIVISQEKSVPSVYKEMYSDFLATVDIPASWAGTLPDLSITFRNITQL